MAPSLNTAFPQTYALDRELFFWRVPFRWSDTNVALLGALWATQVARMTHLPDFWSWTDAMASDLNNARRASSTEVERDAIDCARFITCMPALHTTRSAGQLGACYDWIWTAIAATHVRGQRFNTNTWTFFEFPFCSPELFGLYLRHVPQFIISCFYVGYKFGGLDALTAAIASDCWLVASDEYRDNPANNEALEAMIQMVIWASRRHWEDGEVWARVLLAAADQTSSPRQRLQVAMTFITAASKYVEGSSQEWAVKALREHGDAMVEHEQLQAQAVALKGPEDWQARKAEILGEITTLRRLYLANLRPGESYVQVLELRVSIIHPLVFLLMKWGEIHDLVAVLGAWYRAPMAEPADSNVLAVVPTHNGGAAYLWPGGRWLTGNGDYANQDAMQLAAGRALGAYFRGSEGDQVPDEYANFRFDVVDTSAGHVLETAMARHYRFDELKAQLPADWTPRATIVFPSGPEPLQAMLAKVADLAAPLEISFERPLQSRPIRKISVWAGGPLHETFELDGIRHIALRAGWLLQAYQAKDLKREDLRQFYEDESADVLWVISHGVHDPFSVNGIGIHLPDESLVGLEDLRNWKVPTLGRRLLVLNSCSGAAAQGQAGLARIGLAQSLVSAGQAVVGHLWPVHWTAGLAFGIALAARLEMDPVDTAVLAGTKLLQDPERLIAFLEERFLGCEDLLDRLRRSSEDLTSITNWGCPVLLT